MIKCYEYINRDEKHTARKGTLNHFMHCDSN